MSKGNYKFDLKGRTEAVCKADIDGIIVWLPGVKPHVDPLHKKVFLPMLDEEKLTDDDILKVRFFETHERRHLKYTKLELLERDNVDPFRFWNAIEDTRIESIHQPGREGEVVIMRRGREYYTRLNDQKFELDNEHFDLVSGAREYLTCLGLRMRVTEAVSQESKDLIEDSLTDIKQEFLEVIGNVRRGTKDSRNNTEWTIDIGNRIAGKITQHLVQITVNTMMKEIDQKVKAGQCKLLRNKEIIREYLVDRVRISILEQVKCLKEQQN